MKKDRVISLVLAIIGIFFVGTGVAFNAAATLGNDPIGIVYDGIRNIEIFRRNNWDLLQTL